MAEDESDIGQERGKGKKSVVKLAIIGVVVLLIIGGLAFAVKTIAPGLIPGLGQKTEAASKEEKPKKRDEGPPQLYLMKPFVVNLIDPGGKRYLKATLTLEIDGLKDLKEEFEPRIAPIQDAILILLSSKAWGDISTPEGKTRLRSELINRCNALMTKGQVKNVYFSEFVVQ